MSEYKGGIEVGWWMSQRVSKWMREWSFEGVIIGVVAVVVVVVVVVVIVSFISNRIKQWKNTRKKHFAYINKHIEALLHPPQPPTVSWTPDS